jgi:hypothetical protein
VDDAAVLDVLTPEERAAVLGELLTGRPELFASAGQVARRLLVSVTVEDVASEVSSVLTGLAPEDLAARVGRVRGRGDVHETDAAWGLVNEVIESFVADVSRRAGVGLVDAARSVVVVAGLHQVRNPDDGSVLAYAGPDASEELAEEVLREAGRLGLEIPDDASVRWWPRWTDLD